MPHEQKTSVVIIDDHKLLRQTWKSIFTHSKTICVAGDTGDPVEAIELVKRHQPDVVLVDMNMKPVDGFEMTKRLLRFIPSLQVLIVSMFSLPSYVKEMMRMGAKGYVSKDAPIEELLTAITTVAAGKKYISREMRKEYDDDENAVVKNIFASLSVREMQIARLTKTGLTAKEIAEKLNIAFRTVEVHRTTILTKLNVKNRAELVNLMNLYEL